MLPAVLSRHCTHSSIRKIFLEWEDDYNNPCFLTKLCIRRFYLQIITSQNWLSQQSTSSCWATTTNSISSREVLDSKNQKRGEYYQSSVPVLLQVQGTSITTTHGWAAINTSTTVQAISHYRRGLCWTSFLKLGPPRSKVITKGYIAIFVCFVTKAVHIEVVTSLTTEAFLAALRRFIARREKPRTLYSDNGTNFQGAANELHGVAKMLQSTSQMSRIHDFLATEGCTWNFIPPHGPHFGGLWEAAVKSMKYHLRRMLGSRVATYEELYTLLTEIEACLNSRPLCALSDDPFNPTYLSPGHFLIGEPLTQLPVHDYTKISCNRLSRWQTYQQQLQQFWQCWSADYLQGLQQRQQWQRTVPNLQPGDLILLREDNTTPLQWPTAVITDVHPGRDGIVRVVTLRTPKGTLKRPITKICPLPRVNE